MADTPEPESEIRRLELERLEEELRQLRARGRAQWVAPATILALIPLAAGFGLFVWNEIKAMTPLYDRVVKADAILAENDALEAEIAALEERRANLNVEITSLIAQYGFYVEQARELRDRFEAREQDVERAWTRTQYAVGELTYTLSHVRGYGDRPDFAALRQAIAPLDPDVRRGVDDVFQGYGFCLDIIDIAEDGVDSFERTLALLPVPERIARLRFEPSPMQDVLVWPVGTPEDYYDVEAGRFLTPEEIAERQ
jgi:hypothetical protein